MFAKSLIWLYITFGLFGGIGFCLMSFPPLIMVARYFDKHLALATGICEMGSGLGTLIFNPVSKILIDDYTWRGTLLIESGFILNGLVIAFILRPPITGKRCKDVSKCDRNAMGHANDETREVITVQNKIVEYEMADVNDSVVQREGNTCETSLVTANVIAESNALQQKGQNSNSETDSDEKQSLIESRIATETDDVEQNKDTKRHRWLSLEPLRNPGFLLLMLSGLLSEFAMNTLFAFLPDLMLRNGYEKEQTVWVMFLIDLMSTIARLVVGIIADLPCISRVYLCGGLLLTNGFLLVLSPFCLNYASFVAFGALFGLTAGGSNVLRGVLIPELFGFEMTADFMGISFFFSSIAAFGGLPKTGALYDASQSYVPPFVMSGSELALSGLIITTIPLVLNWWNTQSSSNLGGI